jgi:hypothetical protein
LNVARGQHTATRLDDGTVLITGGQKLGGAFVSNAEIYDPVAGSFTLTGALNTPRVSHTATLLPNGTVLIAGGAVTSTFASPSAEIYDPTKHTFAETGSLTTGPPATQPLSLMVAWCWWLAASQPAE